MKILGQSNVSAEVRKQELKKAGFIKYPRNSQNFWTIRSFRAEYEGAERDGAADKPAATQTVVGRVASCRLASKKLAFIDLTEQPDNMKLQVVLNEQHLSSGDQNTHEAESVANTRVRDFVKIIQKGDHISVTGHSIRTSTGEFSILAERVPQLLSPCLHHVPDSISADEARSSLPRHVQQMVDPLLLRTLRARDTIIATMSEYLRSQGFVSVQTPILAASAGGAIARPFNTSATEFPDRQLALRIAPELWLKRLIVAGMTSVFEIGPSFRNEGIDASHNPEFTTCEIYALTWHLRAMMMHTQQMFGAIASKLLVVHPTWLEACKTEEGAPWPTIDFIPAINMALGPGSELPNLSLPDAREKVIEIFIHKNLPIPGAPTLPRLLDNLCSRYLESQCDRATWIINTPECLSPLARSFAHPDLPYQQVAARAELFIRRKEVVNCYEEENDPEEQKRKFIEQRQHSRMPSDRGDAEVIEHESMNIDHDYIEALEWGMPPIGGWGCGIDRLVMLMLGRDNIKDVLSFGNLRMVTRGADKVSKPPPVG